MVDIIEYVQQFIPPEGKVIPYSRSHYYMMQLGKYQTMLSEYIPNYVYFFDAQAMSGPNFTILRYGVPMIAAGFVPLWPNVYEGWLLTDKRVEPYWLPMGRASKRIFGSIGSVLQLHRLQFHIHSLDTRAIKYAKFLMFEEECLSKKYGPDGSDYYLMRRLY